MNGKVLMQINTIIVPYIETDMFILHAPAINMYIIFLIFAHVHNFRCEMWDYGINITDLDLTS